MTTDSPETQTNAVPGFVPSVHGLHFANRFPPGPTLKLGFIDPRWVVALRGGTLDAGSLRGAGRWTAPAAGEGGLSPR